MEQLRVGVVGVGNISGIYLENLHHCEDVKIVACADLDVARAEAVAAKHHIPTGTSVEKLLAMDEVDLVLNLTIPSAHADVALAALNAGKHVFSEKPMAIELDDAIAMMELAKRNDLRVGGAPDTFLGGGHQACRQLIDDKAIGDIVSVHGFMICGGHESWHPNPAFYYQPGGGPLFDMGPYYITAFVNLFGPIRAVSAVASATHPTRTVTSEPLKGAVIPVETPTHIESTLEFENGILGRLTTSFDAPVAEMPHIVIYGTQGTMVVPDPNGFDGPIQVRLRGEPDWRFISHHRPYTNNARGLGVRDMARAIHHNHAHRANGELTLHVLEVMHGALESAHQKGFVMMKHLAQRPAAVSAKGL